MSSKRATYENINKKTESIFILGTRIPEEDEKMLIYSMTNKFSTQKATKQFHNSTCTDLSRFYDVA